MPKKAAKKTRKKPQYLVPPARARELKRAGQSLIREIQRVQKEHGIFLECSRDTNIIEIYDPSMAMPKGYEYAAFLSIDEGVCTFEVCELVDEGRETL